MAISLLDNIAIKKKSPNVERDLFATIADMVAYNENYLPDVFECNVIEDGNRYRYNRTNIVDENLGRWRIVASGGSASLIDYYKKTETDALLEGYVSKEDGKGLSANDLTDELKEKYDKAEENVQSDWNETDETSDAFIKNKPTIPSIDGLVSEETLNTTLANYVKTDELPDGYDDTALTNRVKTIEDDYLTSTDKTELTTAIATAKSEAIETVLGESVDADFDTLKEVANWIQSDTTASAELVTRVTDVEKDIDSLETFVNNKVDKVSGKGLSTNDYTTSEKNKLSGIASGAEVNVQSDWNVTDTTSDAFIKNKPTIPTKTSQLINDSGFKTTDNNTTYSLLKSGSTITLTGSDGSTTSVTDSNTTYSNFVKSGSGAKAGLVPAPSTTAGTTKYLREDGTWTTPPDTNTTYSTATQSAQGLMSASDKTKLDGIATGANKTTVDSALSSTSTNPVQNKVINSALSGKASTSVATSSANGLMSSTDKAKLDAITASADAVSVTQKLTSGTEIGTVTINGTGTKLYAPTNTDTKNTAGSTDSSSKIFLVGATSQAANPQTYSHDTAYVGADGHLYSNGLQTVNLSGSQALTNKTYNGYTLAAACAKAVTDSTSASAIGTGASLVTERDVYYGLPTINGSHTYNYSTNIYAPTAVGSSGQVLKSNGSGAPSWSTLKSLDALVCTRTIVAKNSTAKVLSVGGPPINTHDWYLIGAYNGAASAVILVWWHHGKLYLPDFSKSSATITAEDFGRGNQLSLSSASVTGTYNISLTNNDSNDSATCRVWRFTQ